MDAFCLMLSNSLKVPSSLFIANLFFFGSIVFTVFSLYKNNHIIDLLQNNWKSILLLLLINFIFKCPFNLYFFHGLEYEDSYVYKVAARFIFENEDCLNVAQSSYLTNSCIFGSLKNCYLSATYSGHLIGYPCIINLFYSLFGYQFDAANILSLIFSSLSIFFVFVISRLIIDDKLYALICSLVYITIPIFNVFASTSLSELTSNFYISLLLLSYLYYVHHSVVGKGVKSYSDTINWISLFFTMGFVVLIKRENLSLIICLPLASLVYLYSNRKIMDVKVLKKIVKISPIIILTILFYFYVMNITETLEVENLEIGHKAFSISYFVSLMPIFIKSFFHWKWYLFFSIFLFIGFFTINKNTCLLFPIIIFISYFILYTMHHRSYYFVKTGEVYNFETIRYMVGIISLYSLISGMGIYRFINYIYTSVYNKREKNIYIKAFNYISIITIAIVSLFLTYNIRASFIKDEYISRIQPVKTFLQKVNSEESFVITSEPLLFQIYGQTDTKIISFCSIITAIPAAVVDELIDNKKVFYLQNAGDIHHTNRKRFLLQNKYLNAKKRIPIYRGINFNIYQIMSS